MQSTTSARTSTTPQTGREKAAILLASLDKNIAPKVYQALNPEEVQILIWEIANLRQVSSQQRASVIKEFHDLAVRDEAITVGGLDYAHEMLKTAFGEAAADEFFERMSGSLHVRPFEFARKLDAAQLLTFLQNEHPQTIALVLAYLEPDQAAAIMSALGPDLRTDVARRIATMTATAPEVIEQIEQVLEARFAATQTYQDVRVGGVDALVRIINGVHLSAEKAILESLAQEDPDLAEEVKKRMFVFDDIVLLDDRSLQRAIRDVDAKDLQLALKRATEEVKDAIFRNISQRMAETIRQEMEYMGAVRVQDVDEAQQRIVSTIRRLEESGEVIIARGAGADVIL